MNNQNNPEEDKNINILGKQKIDEYMRILLTSGVEIRSPYQEISFGAIHFTEKGNFEELILDVTIGYN